jgi:integrase/recombinase XerD
MQNHLIEAATARCRRTGPVAGHVAAFAAHLAGLGYARSTIQSQVQVVGAFDRWMVRHAVTVADLDDRTVRAFIGAPRQRRLARRGGARTLDRFLSHLRAQGAIAVVPPAWDVSPRAQLERRYHEYLRVERGLCATTMQTYLGFFRQFLTERLGDAGASIGTVGAVDISAFVRQHAHAASPGRAKMMVTALRAMCRFFFQEGETRVDLGPAVPTVPDWRLARLPRSMAADDVERLLSACNSHTTTGRRDRAILLLLARLGLRAGEVIALELGDLDWRAGEMTVRGKKGLRHDRFPLLADVGDALATYLRCDRPPSSTRRVFLCMRAPRRGFARPGTVSTIVRRALDRAGLHPPVRGAHLLRHSLATTMLQHGASFVEIGEVLRHRAASSTEIYAKVDLARLRLVVQPWPGTGGAQ